ncbi:MAG: serine O-acetyltransferase [Gammaproteobacteria bacterium]|nr:MAG: serine O-acetyltransferase [Gammaproteobacteria bacterium]
MSSVTETAPKESIPETREVSPAASKFADPLWQSMREEAALMTQEEPFLASFFYSTILNHFTIEAAISFHLSNKLDSSTVSAMVIREIIEEALANDASIIEALRADIRAVIDRDPVCDQYSTPFLYFKGFHALQAYRIAHWLWGQNRRSLALFIQNRVSEVFAVDIHPAATIGKGIMIDHATGIVVGETSVIEDNVSLMQSVTLGGTGKETGDRHPKIGKGVLVSAGAKILGNVSIGEGVKVAAGSVVLVDVPPHVTVAGVPAKIVGKPKAAEPALDMCQDMIENGDNL